MHSSSIQDKVPPDDSHDISDIQDMEGVKSQVVGSGISSDKISFKEVVSSSSQWFPEAKAVYLSSMEWDEPELEAPTGVNVVQFSKEKLSQLRKPWGLTLMGKCLGILVRPSFITQRVRLMWKPRGTLEVIDLGKDTYLFRFSLQDDYERALFGGPWYVLDHYLMVTQWQPNFIPTHNPFSSMAVWIHLPELPVEYYDKEALFTIASKLGKPIRVDYATNHLTRARYARICIEINLSKPITSKIWIGNQWQVILYENLHSLCFVCGRIGHQKNQCTESKGKTVMVQLESESGEGTDGSQLYPSQNIDTGVSNAKDDGGTFVSNNQGLQSPTRNSPSPLKVSTKKSLGEEFGPWTMVSHP
ncbi:uncharacterized protein LOC125492689 [Beta vulgaris subsp. vulgaris]|uniref:uncharacterized protein LOC125492689 n=1 Tax=Beta vulgaris subsp. vulgaris TaxID=3555 RepID=UPI002036D73E|nr:uncharacterized protein LOC125492689 [Beta vulgaris subsp. vulgaris]